MTSALLEGMTRNEIWPGRIIDADVHANVGSVDTLMPYLSPIWRQYIRDRGWSQPAVQQTVYAPGLPISARPQWKPDDGRKPASDLSLVREHILEPWDVTAAVLTCYYGVDSIRHPDFAAALASAVNDWLIAEWLEKDSRLRASIVVPARYPDDMAREIDRVGDHPGFVQVNMPVRSDRLYGQRVFHPVFDAMVRHDLVMGLHWGGITNGAPSPTGWPSYYVEEHAAEMQVYTAQITSLIGEGVFQSFPDLRVAVMEAGFAFVPIWSWRMDKEWKGLRREIPWLTKSPTSLVREHMRFSIAPLDLGPLEELPFLLQWLGSEDLLMFGTDYPHTHDGDLGAFITALPESMRAKVMYDSAREWYRI
ncbi:amidohydrolase family protein [Mycobacterium sp. 94-17]|uniref:amidohydrolase family protein n=1 Tax=Mycobacterium sp. 94-17 TaxID=2986147 RepID=UPI002D1E5178|nr:amidohydrolase family protein [Mycobacterium sp. 94-17]MEB4209714.1 amidohydrolase family protein [Mycobacterium sp. 94-17]